MAEVSRRWSPYNYVENNPIRIIDPDGMIAIAMAGNYYYEGLDAEQAFQQLQTEQGNKGKDKDKKKKNRQTPIEILNYKNAPHIKPVTGFWNKTFQTLFGERTLRGDRVINHIVYDDDGNPTGVSHSGARMASWPAAQRLLVPRRTVREHA